MADLYYPLSEETGQRMADTLEELNKNVNAIVVGGIIFDGTKKTYDRIMNTWFIDHGVNAMTAVGITDLCNQWYSISKDGWDGNVSFANPATDGTSQVSTGEKGGDNTGLVCTPSTDTTEGRDDYAGLPLFACKNVNYEVDPTSLDILITAIEGITGNYVQNDPNTYVGVMQMSGWHYWYEDSAKYTHGYADHRVSVGNCEPLPEAVRVDGTVRPFAVHSKYYNSTVNGKPTSCSGLIPSVNVSHNTTHTLFPTPYSGGTSADLAFLTLMTYIKYASLTLDNIMAGCDNYNLQYYAQVSETGVKRILLPSTSGILVGSSVLIGEYAGSADRGQAAAKSISAGCVVTAVEDITVSGTAYKAVYVDVDTAFNTVANGNVVNGSTIVSTWHWQSGSCDNVKGNDGSPVSNTDNKHPFKLQGIECMVGGYEVLADVILNETTIDGEAVYVPCIVRKRANQSTSVTANYETLTALKITKPATASWQYIKRLKYTKGVFFANIIGGSSSTYTRDAFYMDAQDTSGLREFLAFGYLDRGSLAGLSCLSGGSALSSGLWGCLARISPNGNRGELAA